MKLKFLIAMCLIGFSAGTLQASEQRGELVLNKIPIYEFEDPRKNVCIGLYDVKFGRDVSDMREFRDFLCQGRYEMTVRGKPGRTVTLYAKFNFGQENGFLVVRKTDDRKVWIPDLESLPSGQWTTIPANSDSGGYEAFYHGGPQFSQRVASVKWGQWWQGDIPRKTGYKAPGDEKSLTR